MTTYTQQMVDLSVALETQRAERSQVEQRIEALITECRDAGMTWAMVGSALHTSGQAAWERYGLSPQEKAERSRQNEPAVEQDTFMGMEVTREERVRARKVALERKRGKRAQKE